MASSVVALWNLALANIGSTSQVASLTDGTKAATQCALWWPEARRQALRAYAWPFATLTETLQQVTYQPPDYQFAFQFPADCLKALEILSPMGRRPPPNWRVPFVVRGAPPSVNPVSGAQQANRYICTDMIPVSASGVPAQTTDAFFDGWGACGAPGLMPGTALPCLRYITDIQDPTVYGEEFDLAVAWNLAAMLAMPMAQAKDLRTTAEQMYRLKLAEAVAVAMNESQRDPQQEAGPQQARNR